MTSIKKVDELIQGIKDDDGLSEVVVRVMLYQYIDLIDVLDINPEIKGGLVKDAPVELKEILGFE